MGEYTVFNNNQLDWVKKVAIDMTVFTMKWNAFEDSISDDDFGLISDRFKLYSEKSRNNKFVIDMAMSFLEYLDTKESYKSKNIENPNTILDNVQFGCIEKFIIKAIDLLKVHSDKELDECNVAQIKKTLTEYSSEVPEHKLLSELTNVFKDYIDFCNENQKSIQMAEITGKRKSR